MGFNTTYCILYDHPPSHSLTAVCGLHCCLVVPSVKEMLGRLCEPIDSHERYRMSLDHLILCSYCMYVYWKENNARFSCIINLNIIYLLKISLIGNQSKGGGSTAWCVLNLCIAYLLRLMLPDTYLYISSLFSCHLRCCHILVWRQRWAPTICYMIPLFNIKSVLQCFHHHHLQPTQSTLWFNHQHHIQPFFHPSCPILWFKNDSYNVHFTFCSQSML